MANNYWRAQMILESNRKRWLKVNPNLNEDSGIYMLTRVDENGLKFAYIGQAKRVLTRLAQHLTQYSHIDLSLKKHGLFKDTNQTGWRVNFINCAESQLDILEQEYIIKYAQLGYQLRNKTSGGQGVGKVGIDNNKSSKGYRDGIAQGRKDTIKEVREYFDKYLDYSIKEPRLTKKGQPVAIKEKKYQEFTELLEETNEKG